MCVCVREMEKGVQSICDVPELKKKVSSLYKTNFGKNHANADNGGTFRKTHLY